MHHTKDISGHEQDIGRMVTMAIEGVKRDGACVCHNKVQTDPEDREIIRLAAKQLIATNNYHVEVVHKDDITLITVLPSSSKRGNSQATVESVVCGITIQEAIERLKCPSDAAIHRVRKAVVDSYRENGTAGLVGTTSPDDMGLMKATAERINIIGDYRAVSTKTKDGYPRLVVFSPETAPELGEMMAQILVHEDPEAEFKRIEQDFKKRESDLDESVKALHKRLVKQYRGRLSSDADAVAQRISAQLDMLHMGQWYN